MMGNKKQAFKWMGLLLALGLFSLVFFHPIKRVLINALDEIQHFNLYVALLYFCLIYIVGNVLCIPIGLPLNLFAGMLWGTFYGGLLVNVLAALVAGLTFIIARVFKQWIREDWFYNKLSRFRQLNHCTDWQFIFAARINPIVPFSLSNYFFGLLPQLSFKRYILVTMLANLIPSFAFASVGSLLNLFSTLDGNARLMVTQISCVLLLISTLFLIKWFYSKKYLSPSNGSL